MAILKVAQLGNPVLRRVCSAVPLETIQSAEFQQLVDNMIETMREYSGVGLAAAQVHRDVRVFVMEVASNRRYPGRSDFPLTIVVNPEVSVEGDANEDGWEGCLSIPGLRGQVRRFQAITLSAQDRNGHFFKLPLSGFPARIVQHEVDHLDGRVFLDRMDDFSKLAFEVEYQRFFAQ